MTAPSTFQRFTHNNSRSAIAMHYLLPVRQSTKADSLKVLLGPSNPQSLYNFFLFCVVEKSSENLLAYLALREIRFQLRHNQLDFFTTTFALPDPNDAAVRPSVFEVVTSTVCNLPNPIRERWKKTQAMGVVCDDKLLGDTEAELLKLLLDTWDRYTAIYGGGYRGLRIRAFGQVIQPAGAAEVKKAKDLIEAMEPPLFQLPQLLRNYA